MVKVRWKGMDKSKDNDEPLSQVYQDVPEMTERMLKRKTKPTALEERARREICLGVKAM